MTEEEKLTYYQKNKEKCLAQAKEYNLQNKEKQKEYWHTYYLKNKAALIKKRVAYAKKHKQRIYEKNRTVYYPRHHQKKQGLTQDPLVPSTYVLSPVEELPWNIKICPGGTVTFD